MPNTLTASGRGPAPATPSNGRSRWSTQLGLSPSMNAHPDPRRRRCQQRRPPGSGSLRAGPGPDRAIRPAQASRGAHHRSAPADPAGAPARAADRLAGSVPEQFGQGGVGDPFAGRPIVGTRISVAGARRRSARPAPVLGQNRARRARCPGSRPSTTGLAGILVMPDKEQFVRQPQRSASRRRPSFRPPPDSTTRAAAGARPMHQSVTRHLRTVAICLPVGIMGGIEKVSRSTPRRPPRIQRETPPCTRQTSPPAPMPSRPAADRRSADGMPNSSSSTTLLDHHRGHRGATARPYPRRRLRGHRRRRGRRPDPGRRAADPRRRRPGRPPASPPPAPRIDLRPGGTTAAFAAIGLPSAITMALRRHPDRGRLPAPRTALDADAGSLLALIVAHAQAGPRPPARTRPAGPPGPVRPADRGAALPPVRGAARPRRARPHRRDRGRRGRLQEDQRPVRAPGRRPRAAVPGRRAAHRAARRRPALPHRRRRVRGHHRRQRGRRGASRSPAGCSRRPAGSARRSASAPPSSCPARPAGRPCSAPTRRSTRPSAPAATPPASPPDRRPAAPDRARPGDARSRDAGADEGQCG